MTQTVEADVLRLFTSEAAFLAGSKRRQMGFDKATKRALLHNDVNDTLAMAWSDDSLQCLLAGPQTVTGAKTYSANQKLKDNISLLLGDSGYGSLKYDGSHVHLKTTYGRIYVDGLLGVQHRVNGVDVLNVDSTGANLKDGYKHTIGTAKDGELFNTGVDVTLKSVTGSLILDAVVTHDVRIGGSQVLQVYSNSVRMAGGVDIWLGHAWQSGAPSANGYVTVADITGKEVQLLAYQAP